MPGPWLVLGLLARPKRTLTGDLWVSPCSSYDCSAVSDALPHMQPHAGSHTERVEAGAGLVWGLHSAGHTGLPRSLDPASDDLPSSLELWQHPGELAWLASMDNFA